MSFGFELAISILLVIGGIFIFVGSFGLLRLPDFYTRLHAPTKATTVGLGSILLCSMLTAYATEGRFSISELLITLFLVITAPVVAHMLAKVAMHHKVRMFAKTKHTELVDTARMQQPPASDSSRKFDS